MSTLPDWLLEQARAVVDLPHLPRPCPPCAADAPIWVGVVRDQYVATGLVELGEIKSNLLVGEKLVGPVCEYRREARDTLAICALPLDDSRVWRVDVCESRPLKGNA